MSKSALRTRSLLLTALFAALTAVGAFLRVPVGPISFTLQVFFTCTAGLLLGPWYGAASQAVYVLLGLIGVPIFTEGGGLMYVAKPSFGFLLGLIPMALIIGLTHPPRKVRLLAHGAGLRCRSGRALRHRPAVYVFCTERRVVGRKNAGVRLRDLPAL